MLLTLSLASNYSQRDCEKGHQLSTLATKCQLCVCVWVQFPECQQTHCQPQNSPPLQPSPQWLQLICCNPAWLMRELVLPSKAEHYGKEEVLLLDGEPGIKGYSCTAHVWLVMCLCLRVNVCTVRMGIDGWGARDTLFCVIIAIRVTDRANSLTVKLVSVGKLVWINGCQSGEALEDWTIMEKHDCLLVFWCCRIKKKKKEKPTNLHKI